MRCVSAAGPSFPDCALGVCARFPQADNVPCACALSTSVVSCMDMRPVCGAELGMTWVHTSLGLRNTGVHTLCSPQLVLGSGGDVFAFGSEYTCRKEALLCLRKGVACDFFLGFLIFLPKRVLHEEGSKGETSGLCSGRPRKRKLLSPWGLPLPHFLNPSSLPSMALTEVGRQLLSFCFALGHSCSAQHTSGHCVRCPRLTQTEADQGSAGRAHQQSPSSKPKRTFL